MKKILIIDGPNLNLLGRRQPHIYGTGNTQTMLQAVREAVPAEQYSVDYFQSNHEGAIIDRIHAAADDPETAGIILNAGAYTHTSLAIADAIAAIAVPVVEVHISNVHARSEQIRHTSLIAPVCRGTITGFGIDSYVLAAIALMRPEKQAR